MLEAVIQNPNQCLARVPFYRRRARRIVEKFNQTARNILVIRRFIGCLRLRLKTPDATALVLSMAQSPIGNSKPAQSNRTLSGACGVQPGARVGVCLERSPELIVSLLAILKAGAAFVPIDPTFPPYIAQVVETGGVRIVTEKAMESRILREASAVSGGESRRYRTESPHPFETEVGSTALLM